MVKYGKCG